MNTFEGFKPVVDDKCEVLILGSFPSVKSREMNFYYGNKQNRFWKVLEEFFHTKIDDDIGAKTKFLLDHHIALWDIVGNSSLKGSSDVELLKNIDAFNDIENLTKTFPSIKGVICNGKAAYNLTTKRFPNLSVIYLPSTSPANVSFKKETWFETLKKFNL